jgi:hypothetical protein
MMPSPPCDASPSGPLASHEPPVPEPPVALPPALVPAEPALPEDPALEASLACRQASRPAATSASSPHIRRDVPLLRPRSRPPSRQFDSGRGSSCRRISRASTGPLLEQTRVRYITAERQRSQRKPSNVVLHARCRATRPRIALAALWSPRIAHRATLPRNTRTARPTSAGFRRCSAPGTSVALVSRGMRRMTRPPGEHHEYLS